MVAIQKKVNQLPTTPGVYLFKDDQQTIIYIGKAVNLKRRVKQYFETGKDLTPKTVQLVANIQDVDYMKTITEFDALLLESNLIRKYQPKYNMIAKDDKSPIYIQITLHERLPHISLVRKPMEVESKKIYYAGPFQSTRIAKSILRSIRRCVPFCSQKKRTGKPCFYTHIGLCTPCPSVIEKLPENQERKILTQAYRTNIYKIKRILDGKLLPVISTLEKEMDKEAQQNHFEQAAMLRDRIHNMRQLLQTHFDPSLYVNDSVAIGETVTNELKDLKAIIQAAYPVITHIGKIECIDISNTAGTDPVGSLVVMEQGVIDRSQYRKFKIQGIVGPNDTAMIYQVVTRRFSHTEWPFPDLLLIDGGKGQVQAAERALEEKNIHIPVVGLAKRYESLVMRTNGILKLMHMESTRPAIRLVKRLRDESHRFALSYHKLRRAKRFQAV